MTDVRQPHPRARAVLFWATLVIALVEAAVVVVIAHSFMVPTADDSIVPLEALPVFAALAVILDVVCIVVGRRANRVLGVIALLVVIAQVLFVLWALNELGHANFVL